MKADDIVLSEPCRRYRRTLIVTSVLAFGFGTLGVTISGDVVWQGVTLGLKTWHVTLVILIVLVYQMVGFLWYAWSEVRMFTSRLELLNRGPDGDEKLDPPQYGVKRISQNNHRIDQFIAKSADRTPEQIDEEWQNIINIQKQQMGYIDAVRYSLKSRFWILDFTLPLLLSGVGIISILWRWWFG